MFANEDQTFDVVINAEEQYSIWPVGRELPEGWYAVGFQGLKADCLTHVNEVWTDITPLSARRSVAAR